MMKRWVMGLVALGGFLMVGAGLQAHHAVAGIYDLNKEIVLQGVLKKLNFTNPHASIELTVTEKDGKKSDWVLTTASIANLTREGINKTSMKPGELLKVTILPARNGSLTGFIRSLPNSATATSSFRSTDGSFYELSTDARDSRAGSSGRDEPDSIRTGPGCPGRPGSRCTSGRRRPGRRRRSGAGPRRRWRRWSRGPRVRVYARDWSQTL